MSDEKKLKDAKNVFNTLCAMLDESNIKYQKHEEDMVVTFVFRGDDLPMNFIMYTDADRQLIRLLSPVPVKFAEEKRIEGAIAACQVNYRLVDGSFDYDYKEGSILFRMTSSYIDSLISKDLLMYMIVISCNTIDKYNDKFDNLAKGKLNIEDFFKG